MSEVLERAVKALEVAQADGLIDGDWPEVVRVVIAAMREPTDAMIAAAQAVGIDQDPRDYWPAMVDEALK